MNRQNGAAAKLPDEAAEPQREYRTRQQHVKRTDRDAGGVKLGCDQPEQIDQPNDQDADDDDHENPGFAFHPPRQQQAERHGEMKDDERDADQPPTGVETVHVPCDFGRQVAGPDDQILRKGEVRPEHDERQQQVAEVVKVRRHDDSVERRPSAEPHKDRNQKRHRRKTLTTEDEHAVDGREPVRLEGHQPVERRKRDRQAVRDEPAGAQKLHAARDSRIGRLVLLERPRVQEIGERVPDQKIDTRTHDEERRVEVHVFVLQRLVARNERRIRPAVQAVHAEENRQKERREHRQRPRRGTDRPSDDDAPRAAGELVHHAERQGSERDPEHEHVRHQVRLQELRDVDDQPHDRHGEAGRAGNQQLALTRSELGNGLVGRLPDRDHVLLSRAAAFTRRGRCRQLVPVRSRNIVDPRVLTELQRADVRGNGPPIAHARLRRVVGHRAEPVRHHVEEVSDRRVTEAVLMIGGRPTVAASDDHAVALSGSAVARRTIDVESFLAAHHHGSVNRKGKDGGVGAVRLAGEEQRVFAELPSCDRTRHERPGGAQVGEKGRFAQRDVLRLIVHVLPACHGGAENTEKE